MEVGFRIYDLGFRRHDRSVGITRPVQKPIPTSYILHSTSSARRGISLLEVLIAIFIVAVGLVSIASLLPVGSIQLERASIEERKACLGANALRGFQIRDFANPNNWYAYDDVLSPPTPAWIPYKAAFATVDQSKFLSNSSLPNSYLPTLAIDPLMVAVGSNSTPDTSSTVDLFPANYAVSSAQRIGPIIRRLTLSSAVIPAGTSGGLFLFTPNKPLADAICTLADDIITSQPDNSSQPGTGTMTQDNSATPATNIKRSYEGLYTWLATLAPYNNYPEGGAISVFGNTSTPMNQYMLSVVIFYRRILQTPMPATDQQGQEEMVSVPSVTTTSSNVAGGEFLLNDNSANASAKLAMAKPGQWIMFCRYRPAVIDPSTATPQYFPWVEAKWYRVVTVGDVVAATAPLTGYQLQVTLAGDDWGPTPSITPSTPAASSINWPPTTSVPTTSQNFSTYACLFDGAVGVYQRLIHLDGTSVWSE